MFFSGDADPRQAECGEGAQAGFQTTENRNPWKHGEFRPQERPPKHKI